MRHRSIVNSLGDLATVDRPQTRLRLGSPGLIGQDFRLALALSLGLGSLELGVGLISQRLSGVLALHGDRVRHRSIVHSLGDLVTVDRPQTRLGLGSLGLIGRRSRRALGLRLGLGSLELGVGLISQRLSGVLALHGDRVRHRSIVHSLGDLVTVDRPQTRLGLGSLGLIGRRSRRALGLRLGLGSLELGVGLISQRLSGVLALHGDRVRHRSIVNSLGDLATVDRPQTRLRLGSPGLIGQDFRLALALSLGLGSLELGVGLISQRLSGVLALHGDRVRHRSIVNSLSDLVTVDRPQTRLGLGSLGLGLGLGLGLIGQRLTGSLTLSHRLIIQRFSGVLALDRDRVRHRSIVNSLSDLITVDRPQSRLGLGSLGLIGRRV
ncbi:hypothetical protein MCHLDSM_01845 [Mycolicibacterium chlorophenolicum]|uniref:Uncharacterized protein n=1 Tax=Mycolicibacterium chlorophenolicum TaxID=37916 RepID=A0A0J6W3P7_9MYCO|nr:hypothetical protein MCHLDSM_01845 [Mycolicibacterium chlorophenolicum]